MALFFFASDLHGDPHRYESLYTAILRQRPDAVLLGGDLLPSMRANDFLENVLAGGLSSLRRHLGDRYPSVFLILGNDDPRVYESAISRHENDGLWMYLHGRSQAFGRLRLYGYSYVPPTPFQLKDWERYDVSHYIDPGSVSPEDGFRTVDIPAGEARHATIQSDLARLVAEDDLRQAIFLFHTPPYQTRLDRAALDGKSFDYVPLDVHVGSVAVRRFIEERQPLMTLHGHVHESARITGAWMDRIGRTVMLSAAHDGPELALIRFDPDDPASVTRDLL